MQWNKAQIQKQWRRISFEVRTKLSPIEKAYCAFYGIDFSQHHAQLSHQFGYFEACGFRLACHYYQWPEHQAKATLVVQHGYFDHSGLFRHLIEFALTQKLDVLIYDLPGHGLSTGERAGIDDFQHYVEVLDDCLKQFLPHTDKPWHLLGQSTGGAITMAYLTGAHYAQTSHPVSQVFLLAPLVRPLGWQKMLWLYRVSRHWVKSVRRKILLCSHDADFLRFLTQEDPLQDKRIPLSWVASLIEWASGFGEKERSTLSPLIIQGGEDTTIDWRYNLSVIDQVFAQPHFAYLPHARHHLVNESTQYRAQVFALIAQRLDHALNPT